MWYGRHASSRIRSELMAAVYDKAPKRKDAADMANAGKGPKRKEKDPMKQEKAGIGKVRPPFFLLALFCVLEC